MISLIHTPFLSLSFSLPYLSLPLSVFHSSLSPPLCLSLLSLSTSLSLTPLSLSLSLSVSPLSLPSQMPSDQRTDRSLPRSGGRRRPDIWVSVQGETQERPLVDEGQCCCSVSVL